MLRWLIAGGPGPLFPAVLALLIAPAASAAQRADSVTVVASDRYVASALRERLLGRDYRDLWATPIRVPVLDLSSFAGGLTPVQRGGGLQTRSLRLRGGDGREYNFRSVEKDITRGLPQDLRETAVDDLLQDQISSLHPAAAVVAAGLLDAVEIPHPGPRLVVLPDDARLGEFRAEFAGLLGNLEVHADEADDESSDFAGAAEVDGSDDVVERVQESFEHRVDARAYLAERLMSLLMGDWDRHAGQYRWARFDSAGVHRWVPIPEDRDYAFSDFDGLLIGLAGPVFPEAAPFGGDYPTDLLGLLENAGGADRRFLPALPWPAWDSVATRLQADLTDREIEAAVRRMPREYFPTSGPELIRLLRIRRDALHEVARRFYLLLAREGELHGTDQAERAEVLRLPDGSVRVIIRPAGPGSGTGQAPVDRTFLPAETREVRLFLHGGDDAVEVRGSGGAILVRVVGGEGSDSLHNTAEAAGRAIRTVLHDADEGVVVGTAATVVDRAEYTGPGWVPEVAPPPRDWGSTRSWFVPWAGYEGTEGIIVGGGPVFTWYGFRRLPFAARVRVRGMYGLGSGGLGIDATAEARGIGAAPDVLLHARVSGLEAFRFHGFGNQSPRDVGDEIVRYEQRLWEARLGFRPRDGVAISMGPVFEHLTREAEPDGVVEGLRRSYGKAGLAAGLSLASPPAGQPLGGGYRLAMEAGLFPAAWDLRSPIARLRGSAAAFLPLPGRAVLAGRLGGERVTSDAPLPEAAMLGGSETLRGYAYQRFSGDAMVFGGLEARAFLTPARLVLNGDLGALAFADAGRVWWEEESEGGWHTGAGAGLWFHAAGRTVSATVAHGEDWVVYLRLGLPF